ncbi:MAG TPA: acyl-CoA dehydrogenase family protein [Acidimicrobiales bacterium]|nr:acyl-CoA dehydrogenase family protein [Acidimicrobiales bacterium]
MDFTFSAEQDDFRQAVRTTLAAEAPPAYVRAMIDDPVGVSPALWETMASLGWLGVLVPESAGGLGLGLLDLVVLQEELGALPFPGPFLSSAVLATLAAVRLGADDLLGDLAAGRRRGTVALEEAGHGAPLAAVGARSTPAPGGGPGEVVLAGTKPLVLDGATADWALVVAHDDDGLATFLLDAPAGETVPALDVTRKVARLVLDGRRARRLGPPGDQTALWSRVLDDLAVAVCAELVGTSQRALDLAVEYAKVRVQFDRPIATFQVIKHKAADMLHRLELARVGTHYAAWTADVDDPERQRAAAMCKAFVAEAADFVTAECIQVHGGIGFTWDIDAHLLYRRAKQDDVLFGAQGYQRQRLADLILGPVGQPSASSVWSSSG